MTYHHNDWPMLTAALLIGVIGVAVLTVSFCIQPTPRPTPLPMSTLIPAPTLGPTLTTVIAGPASPHVPSTYRPTPTSYVVIPSLIPTLMPATTTLAPLGTATNALATSVPTPAPSPSPVFRPPPPVPAPAQIPRRP